MFEQLFRDREFIEPKDLEAAKILSKTKQWQLRRSGNLRCFRADKKVLYTREHIRDYFALCEQNTNSESANSIGSNEVTEYGKNK